MSERNDGGPAFPVTNAIGLRGMLLRDYFAAKAFNAVYSRAIEKDWQPVRGEHFTDMVAEHCYLMADAMLKAREGKV